MYNVAIAGANGKMGKVAQVAISQMEHFTCSLLITRQDDISAQLKQHQPDILLDLTSPDVVFKHCKIALENNIKPIIGTSGLSAKQVSDLQNQAKASNCGGIIAPNFSISAMLMIHFTKIASQHFESATIIEQHHVNKKDAPSGTAQQTAKVITNNATTIHSIRRPGVLAKQSVILANNDESLSIIQESSSRASFILGMQIACQKVITLDHLVYGLDRLIF